VAEQRATKNPGAKRRRRRILVVSISFAIVLATAWVARARIASGLARRAALRLAGVELSWTSFELDGLSHAAIEGLRVRGVRDDALIRTLDIDSLEVTIEPLELVREGLSGLRALRARGVRGEYEVKSSGGTTAAPAAGGFSWPAQLPEVRIDDVDFDVVMPDAKRVSLRGGSAHIAPKGSSARLEIDATRLAWSEPGVNLDHPLTFEATYDAGRFEIARCAWDPRVVVQTGSLDLSRAALGVSAFALRVGALGGELAIGGRLEHGDLDLDVSTSVVDLGAAFAMFSIDAEVAAHVALKAHTSMPLADPSRLNAVLDLDASDVDILGVRLDRLSGRLRVAEGVLEAQDAFAARGANAIQLDFARLQVFPWDGCTALDRLTARAAAEIGELPTFLREVIQQRTGADVDARAFPAISVRATLAGGQVEGDVASKHVKIAPLVALFTEPSVASPPDAAAPAPLDGDVDFNAHVVLPIDDARRTQGRVDVDARDVDLLSQHLELVRGRLRVDELALHAEDVLAIAGGNVVEIPYAQLPKSDWTACNLLDHAVARLSVEWTDIPSLASDTRDTAVLARLPPHRLAFRGALFDQGIQIEAGDFETSGNSFHIDEGRVPLRESVRAIVRDPELDLSLSVRFDEVRSVWRVFEASLPEIAEAPSGSVAGRVRVRGHSDGPRGHLALRAEQLTIGAARFDEATLRADVDAGSITVETLEAATSLGTLSARGRWAFDEQKLDGARIEADLVDLARVAPGRLPSGAVHLSAELDGRLSALDGFVRFDAEDLSWNGVHIENAALEARADKGKVRVADLSGKSGTIAARLAGDLEALDVDAKRWRLDLSRLDLDVEGSRLSLAHSARFEAGPGAFSVDGLVLAGAEGELDAAVALDRGVTCADIRVRGVALEPLIARFDLGLPTKTRIDCELHVEREGESLRATTQGTLATILGANAADKAEIEAGSCALSWNATLADRRLNLDSVEFTASTAGDDSVFLSAGGSVPLDVFGSPVLADGPLDLRATANLEELALLPFAHRLGGLRGAARFDLDLHGAWNRITGTAAFAAENLAWRALDSADDIGPCSVAGDIDFGSTITLRSVHATLPGDARLDVSGGIATAFDARALAAGDLAALRAAELTLDAHLVAADLAPIGQHVTALRRTGGRVKADVTVRGTLDEPKIEGLATLEDGEIRTMTSLPALSSVRADVRFDGSVLRVETLRGELGGAPFEMSGEAALFGPKPSIDVTITGHSLLLYRQSDVSVRANAELRLHGPMDGLELSGNVALENSRYARKFDFLAISRQGAPKSGRRGFELFSLREAPFDQMRLNIKVTSVTPFEVSNNIVHGTLRPELQLAGTGELPELRGTIFIDPSRVLLPSGTLQVRSGRVEFRLDHPEVPILDIQAHTRLQGYDIDIMLDGPYDDPRVDFSSVPPLSREDLALLVVTGRPPTTGLTLATGQRAAVDVAVYLAQDLAAAWLGGDAEAAESFAERLEVIVGSEMTKSGADAVLVRMRIGGKLAERADAFYLTGERDVYDFYNFGLRFVFSFR
jgi:hypothetical protein